MAPEQALRDSELRYRRLFEAAQDGILILDATTGMIEDVNPYLIKMLGYSRDEFLKKKLWEVGAFQDIGASKDAFEVLQGTEYIRYEDLPLKTKDGRLIQVEFVSNVYLVGDEKVIQCDIRDITEHRQILTALQKNEQTYHDLINQSPDGYFIIELSGNILHVNEAMCKALEFSAEELLSMNIWEIIPEEYLHQYRERLTKVLNGESLKEAAEYLVRGKDGGIHYVEVLSAPRYSGKDIIGFQGIARDITARKRAEAALQESESKFRRLIAHLPTVVYMNAMDDAGTTLYISPQIETLLGYTPQEWLADPELWSKTLHPEDRQQVLAQVAHTDRSKEPFEMEYRMVARDGRNVWVHDQLVIVNDANNEPQFWQGIMLDITERKQTEETLHEKESLLYEAQRIGRMGSWSYSIPADVLQYTDEMYRLLETSAEEFQHNKAGLLSLIYAADQPKVQKWLDEIIAGRHVKELDFRLFHKNGELRYLQSRGVVRFDLTGNPATFIGIAQDVSERKLAEMQIQQQIGQLTSLGKIDKAIISSFDLSSIMEMVLAQVISHLQADAAAILLMDRDSQTLGYLTRSGFRAHVHDMAPLAGGQSLSGRAAREKHVIRIDDLRDQPHDPFVSELLAKEGFVSYFGMPLISRGSVNGVLEVFHRASHYPYPEWVDFLHTLAGQAAIAIENRTLFTNLEQSNSELSQAYDATIEGWSRALDLRDKETEGHSLRVTELTLKLACKFDFTTSQIQHARWGALLHDIGKMGIPDHILLKPGELSAEETLIMRRHPQYSYDLLQPIAFLLPALDIPYCHHEKWDGSGYPRGLKGDEIPRAARVFAVADVWDALCADRPYRAGWPQEKVRDYIRSQSGKYFDPQVVDAFLGLQL
jgi:PAS domain S-box-containing protein